MSRFRSISNAEISKKPIANKFDFLLAVDAALLRLQSITEAVAAFFGILSVGSREPTYLTA
jgi:hypothetical protein